MRVKPVVAGGHYYVGEKCLFFENVLPGPEYPQARGPENPIRHEPHLIPKPKQPQKQRHHHRVIIVAIIIILSGGIAASGDRAHGNAIPRPYALTSEHQNVSANLETW